jgi:hypothetical protein
MRTCTFCGSAGPLHLEHAAPEWLLIAVQQAGGGEPGLTYASFGPDEEERTWRGPEITVRNVCDRCNHGWMSVLESQTKPIVKPLLADLVVTLGVDEQRVLARWGLKTAMVFASIVDSPAFAPAERQAMVSSDSLPLTGISVWIGRQSVSNELYFSGRRLLNPVPFDPAQKELSELVDGFAATFGFGRVVLQFLRLRRREGAAGRHHTLHIQPGPWHRALAEVWPVRPSGARWPPPLSFSETGVTLDELAHRFLGPRGLRPS